MYYTVMVEETRTTYFAIKAEHKDDAYELASEIINNEDFDWDYHDEYTEIVEKCTSESDVSPYTPIFEADDKEIYKKIRD